MTSVLNVDSIAAKDGTSPVVLTKQSPAKSFITGTYSGGTPSNNKSLNVASIVDTATGRVTVNFSSAFDSVNYAPLSNTHQSGNIDASQNLIRNSASQLAMRFAESGTTETDPSSFYGATHGDLA